MNAAITNAVALWRGNRRDAGYLLALLPAGARREAMRLIKADEAAWKALRCSRVDDGGVEADLERVLGPIG